MARSRLAPVPPRRGRLRSRPWVVESLEPRTLLSGGVAAGYVGSIAPPSAPLAAKGDWTVMVYVTATDLAENARANIVEMEKAAAKLPGSVKIVVMYDQWANVDEKGKSSEVAPPGSPGAWKNAPGALTYPTGSGSQPAWGTAGIGVISPHRAADGDNITSSFAISTSEVDTGSRDTLENFVVHAALAAPADHYALVVWDHGGGVAGFNVDSYDVLPKDELTTNLLVGALQDAAGRGVKVDLVGFDACLMSTVEVAYALRDVTSVVVGSEESIGGSGWDYETALNALATPKTATARDLARSMVRSFQNRYQPREAGRAVYATDSRDTLSAIDTAGMTALTSALHAFVASTEQARPRDWTAILAAYRKTPFFGGKFTDLYRDLGRFVAATAAAVPSPAIRAAALGVSSALGNVVFARTKDVRGTSGLSIGLPPRASGVASDYVAQIDGSGFTAAADWTRFQARFHRVAARTRNLAGGEPNWAYNDNGVNSALDLKALVGKGLTVPRLTIDPGATAWYKFSTRGTGSPLDRIRAVGGDGLRLKIVNGDDPAETIARGVGAVSLRGLEAGDYLLAVTAPLGRPPSRFGLIVRGPASSRPPIDVPEGVGSKDRAAELGTIHGSFLVANQSRSSANVPSWYAFETYRSAEPYKATVTLLTDGQPLRMTLSDADGAVLKRAAGDRRIVLNYTARGEGETYNLKISGAPGAFSLFFGDLSNA